MTGNLFGKQFRVVGRVVLGEEENGRTYYWNEFNLESDDGHATLVYERTERGAEWRLFSLFEPACPMTAEEAGTKRLGDGLNLEGMDMFVRLVSLSRVYQVEGKAPEGESVGAMAHYFNAVTGNNMIVVSWTGKEVEFYKGQDLTRLMVSSAFNVRIHDFSRLFPAPGSSRLSALAVGAFIVVVLATLAAISFNSFMARRRPPAIERTGAPVSPLEIGKTGQVGARRFRVQSHMLVEMAMVGRTFDRHEYLLSDDEGAPALLVRGSTPAAGDWWLFSPLGMSDRVSSHSHSPGSLSAQDAAALRWGQSVNVNGMDGKVTDLFQCTIRQVESAEASELKAGDVFFGFCATTPNSPLLVRWTAQYINFFRGEALLEKDVLAGFGQPSSK